MSIVLRLQERPTVNPVRAHRFSRLGKTGSRVRLAAGVLASLALFPLMVVQGTATRRRMPSLPAAKPPHRGFFPRAGPSLRILAIGDSSVSGVGVARGDETVSATTARALARLTGRPVAWRAVGLSGATVSKAMDELVPRLVSEPADLLIVAFGVNDAVATVRRPPSPTISPPSSSPHAEASATRQSSLPAWPRSHFFRACHGPCARFSVGGAPRYRRRPRGSADCWPVSSLSDFPRCSCPSCLPATASIPTGARTRCGGRRLRHWRCRCWPMARNRGSRLLQRVAAGPAMSGSALPRLRQIHAIWRVLPKRTLE